MREEDLDLLSQWTSSRTWVYASGIQSYTSPAELRSFLERVDDEFLMVCTPDGQPIGMVSWKPTNTPGNYQIGTLISDSDLWGAGFGLEAAMALISMLFNARNAHRVEFTCGAFNLRAVENFCSGLVTVEGVLRDYYFVDGEYHDALVGSILRHEYYAAREPSRIVPLADRVAAQQLVSAFLDKNPVTSRTAPAEPHTTAGAQE